MLCLCGFGLYSRWVPLEFCSQTANGCIIITLNLNVSSHPTKMDAWVHSLGKYAAKKSWSRFFLF